MTEPAPAWLYLGTGDVAIPLLETMIAQGNSPIAVVSAGDSRANTQKARKGESTVAHVARQHGIAVIDPHDDEQILDCCRRVCLAVVFSFGRRIPDYWMACTEMGFVNVHPSLLPRWRGASPIAYTTLAGDHRTGITLMMVRNGWDCGEILAQDSLAVPSGISRPELTTMLAHRAAESFAQWWPSLIQGDLFPGRPQPTLGVCYAPKLKKNDGFLCWKTSTTQDLARKIAAMNPWPGAWWTFRQEAVRLWQATVIHAHKDKDGNDSAVGTILDRNLTIRTRDGALRMNQIQRPGRRIIDGKAAMAGWRLRPGDSILDPLPPDCSL